MLIFASVNSLTVCGGQEKSPILLTKILITKEHILALADAHLGSGPLFVTSIRISADNQINVFIDGDEGVTIADCVALSRAIENALDRDKDDFALDVSSHGATNPLSLPRQFKRHRGRNFEVRLADGGKTEGELVDSNDTAIVLESTVRENKPVGKGKMDVTRQQTIPFSQIREARIKLKF